MVKKLFWTIILFSLINIGSSATETMRKCVLLPIQDSVGGAMAFSVFTELEAYLQESTWCYYKSNSEIMDILGHYRKNLKAHLQNREVLKLVSEKLSVGSLIIINLENSPSGVEVEIKIVGENGEDIYLSEKVSVNSVDPVLVVQAIKNWFVVYQKDIPYVGRVTGILGDQFTLDAGSSMGVREGSMVRVSRPINKKHHPLLNKIIEWETRAIGRGRIFHVTDFQAQGKIEEYYTNSKLKIEDWASIKKESEEQSVPSINQPDADKYKFGKLGTVGISFGLGKASDTALTDGISSKKIGGLVFGLDASALLWISRNYWGSVEIGKGFGTLKDQEGRVTKTSNSLSTSSTRVMFGYKYLPLGFFYGPQIDGYFGYASYGYGLDTSSADGITGVKFSGPALGVNGSLPIHKLVRVDVAIDFLISTSFEQDVELIAGEPGNASSFSLKGGAIYQHGPGFDISTHLVYRSNEARYNTSAKEVKLNETMVKFGCIFTY